MKYILTCLLFNVSSAHTRSTNLYWLFYLKSQITNYATNTPLLGTINFVSKYNIEPFCSISFNSFKNHVSNNLFTHIN